MKESNTIKRIRHVLLKCRAEQLPQLVLLGSYSRQSAHYSRSLLWKIVAFQITGHLEELSLRMLRECRKDYEILRSEFMVPWNELAKDHEFYCDLNVEHDLSDSFGKKLKMSRMRIQRHPLDTPKAPKMTDIQTLESLIADVDRLFPQIPEYFVENKENRRQLIEVLYIWWKLNGRQYSQGLHEIAGMIFITLKRESICKTSFQNVDPGTSLVVELMDSKYLRHDVFSMFHMMTESLVDLYYDETSLLQESIKFDLKLRLLDKYQYHLLKNKLRIESSIWLIRYFRLLLIREIGLEYSFDLWDTLVAFSYTQHPEKLDLSLLLPYIIILLLSLIKSQLIISDYGEAMYLLLHYPIEDRHKNHLQPSAILINEDAGSPTEESTFTYIQENHQSKNSGSFDCVSTNKNCQELLQLDIPQITKDAIALYHMSDQELSTMGTQIIELYSGLSNEENKDGVLSASPIKNQSSPLGDMLKRSASWTRKSSSSGKNKNNSLHCNQRKDFDRTRLELRLLNKVSQALRK
ncbi:hypothetical protein KL911_000805 [Ogataea haglerorum]|uniref:uncharacterized protein n=1 Tax=Ogataea haglerorum TaxID=1937702 RepID=UPI001C8AA530|nr:uncharacterized protein KL911_000805 [Ogataea haglerorum]KAG7750397.1 hypothetical protein KL912_000957 [Ogataea haglerorum]KAG7757829.1 hypothetical protein KL911_000805 [Ogataea haglerorum]